MKKFCCIILFLIFLLSITPHVSATSWVVLEPEKVVDRSDVIVRGTYDFSSEPELSHFVFQGLDFQVKTAYKGDVPKILTAGIDGFDIGWAQEFQNQGGEFVLFLQTTEGFDFLVPVAGPNGMVQVQDGKVQNDDEERKTFFTEFLKTQKEAETSVKSIQEQIGHPAVLYFASAGMVVIIALFIMIYRRWRKRAVL
jgi:hypothetical protein